MRKAVVLAVLLAAPCVVMGQGSSGDNSALAQLMQADQAARKGPGIDWDTVRVEDAARREQVLGILREGGIRTAADWYNAALVFQHGESTEDIRLAHAMATLSATLAEEPRRAHWLQAASWDRLLMRFDQPQWYGTQYTKTAEGVWTLHPVLPNAVSDQQREAWGVPSLEMARERAERMNERRRPAAETATKADPE